MKNKNLLAIRKLGHNIGRCPKSILELVEKQRLDLFLHNNKNIILAGACKGPKSASFKEAEASAILRALKKANKLGLSRVHILIDALSMVKALKGEEDSSIKTIVDDILDVVKAFELSDFSFILRKFNRDAHLFAKLVLKVMITLCGPLFLHSSCPESILMCKF